jgi:glycosyltransferase involved in cell wall biosynthesis
MGKPIITTDVAGCNETVINGINGYLIPAQNVDSLVKAMIDMYSLSPEKRLQMGNESRTKALDQFAVQHINTKYLNIISELK